MPREMKEGSNDLYAIYFDRDALQCPVNTRTRQDMDKNANQVDAHTQVVSIVQGPSDRHLSKTALITNNLGPVRPLVPNNCKYVAQSCIDA